MSTVTANKTKVEAKWNTTKIQEEVARVHGLLFLTAMNNIAKLGGEKAVTEFQTEMRAFKVEHLKTLGVKTPIELVKAVSEFEANVFGSKVEIWGDEKTACMQYNSCALWNAMQTHGKLNEEQKEKMGHSFDSCMQHFAKDLGFKAETKFEGEVATITFTK